MHLICHIIDLYLQVFLLHLQYLPLILKFTHFLLLFQYIDLLLFQELIESFRSLLIVDLLLLQLPQFICKFLKLLIPIDFLLFQIFLEFLYICFILRDLLFVILLSHLQTLQSCLFGLIKIVIEHDNWLIFPDAVAHIAHSVLFGVVFAQLLFIFRALFAHTETAPIAIVARGLECAELFFAESARICLGFVYFVNIEVIRECICDEIFEGLINYISLELVFCQANVKIILVRALAAELLTLRSAHSSTEICVEVQVIDRLWAH